MNANGNSPDVKKLEQLIGYSFNDKSLLSEALTHPSLDGKPNYQRLEFLGDRVLGLVVANWLFETYPNEKEGELSRRFIGLVRKETLADVAASMGLVEFISVKMAKDNGSSANSAIQADVVEAIIAAIYKEAGIEPATEFIKTHFASFLENITDVRDPKSALQEFVQAKGLSLPSYIVESREGPDHSPVFHIKVVVDSLGAAKASGSSKREAEVKAAEILLAQLSGEDK